MAPPPTGGTPARANGGPAEQQLRRNQALQRLPGLKQNILLASIAAFSVFSLLVGSHQIGNSSSAVTANQGGIRALTQSGQDQQEGSGYFDQTQGDYGFGSSGVPQAPIAGSGAS
jgi:hypothetical protein